MTKANWLRRTAFVLIAFIMFVGLFKLGLSTIVKFSRPDVDFNLVVDEDTSLMLKFERGVRLKALRVSGSIAGNGTARIYVENNGKKYLVLDSERLDEVNSLDTSDLEFNDNENIVGAAVNELPKKDECAKEPFNFYTSFTINEALDNSGLNPAYDRSGHIAGEIDSESKGFAEDVEASMQPSCSIEESAGDISKIVDNLESAVLFKDICIETCSLQGFDKHSYRMVFEVDNAVINIDNIEYAFRRIWEREEIEPELNIRDSEGKNVDALIQIKDKKGRLVSEDSIEKGLYDVSVELEQGPVRSIEIRNVDLDNSVTEFVNVDDVPKEKEGRFVEVYAIDPTKVDFTEATITVTARGSSLYKCRDWNFSEQRCYGEWELFKTGLIPGKEYSFILTPEDPGFGEINIIDAEHRDKSRKFLSNIFNETREQDGIWSEPIYHDEYVRATFQENLSNGNTINIYVRNNQSLNTFIEVYEQDGFTLLGSTSIIDSGQYDVVLSGMPDSNDILDLKIVNFDDDKNAFLEFDFIQDAPPLAGLNITFYALNSSREVLGEEASFNITNLQSIEYMVINFTVIDDSGIFGDIVLFYTANGTNACALGNNQSSTCYSYPQFIEFKNGTISPTFDAVNGNQGDSILCSYTGNSTHRDYTCELDEHYNPNVWKHYPYNFSDVKWQSATNQRIKVNNIWKIELDTGIIPQDADYYKLDFRTDPTLGLTPTQPILAYLCNSSYTTGDPSVSPECQLVASKLPSELQDDGTKFRALFTKNLTNSLGDIRYVLLTSDSQPSKYYSMKTYRFRGNDAIRTSISNDNGASYVTLSDGYETELNINWFYDSINSNNTQIIFKVQANNTLGNLTNSSEQVMSWNSIEFNLPPLIDIISPGIDSNLSGMISIQWTTAEPNGDEYATNITLNNGTKIVIASNLPDNVSTYNWDSSTVADGIYNLTVKSCENNTVELYCGNNTHSINIDNTNPSISVYSPVSGPYGSSSILVNFTATDANGISELWFYNGTGNVSYTSPSYINLSDGAYNFIFYANDTAGNMNQTSAAFTIDTKAPGWSNNRTYPASGVQYNAGAIYQFNVTWTDTSAMGDVWFEHNFTGALNNYSASGNLSNEYFYNYSNLAAGTYVWRSYANDTFGFTNYTEQWAYIVQPDSTPPSVKDVTATPSSINQTQTTNITANITDASALSEVWARIVYSNGNILESLMNQDGDIWYYEFTTTRSHPGGVYNVTIRAKDANNNWNQSEGTTFTVNDITKPNVTGLYTTSNYDVGSSVDIYVNVTEETGISAVIANISWDSTYNIVGLVLQPNNVTYAGSFSNTNDIAAYTVRIIANDTINNVNNSETTSFNITDISAPKFSSISASPSSGVSYSAGASYQFNVTWTDNYAVDTVLIEHNFAGSLQNYSMGNLSSEYYYNYTDLAAGSYVWRSYANDTSSNKNQTVQQDYSVNEVSSTCSLIFSLTSPQDYGTAINASCSCTNPEASAALYRDGTNVNPENNQLVVLAVGDYLYNCTTSATQNYTSAYNYSTYNITKKSSLVDLTLNGYDNDITINQTQSVIINASLVIPSIGYIELYQDSVLINSGQSLLTNTTAYDDYGTFNITVVYLGGQNYSSSFETHFITVQNVLPPGTITNLDETAVGYTWIYWSWTEPSDADFDEAIVYIDGVNVVNTSNNYYNETGLTPNTNYTISIRTADTAGNINTTWVNDTATTLADIISPEIVSYTITPRVVITGRDVSIAANATDNIDVSVFANITLPNSTVLTLALPSNYTTLVSERHNVTIIANDTSGNTATETDYFIAAEPVNFTVFTVGYNFSGMETNLTIFFPGTNEEISKHLISGNISDEQADYTYDLEFLALNENLTVRLNRVNISLNSNETIGFDKLPTPLSGDLVTYGIYSTFSFNYAAVTLYYAGVNYSDESRLRAYKCDNWDFTNRDCLGSFAEVSASQDTNADTFVVSVNSFSGFSIREVTPSAPVEEEEVEEEIWRMSRGCFFSWECGNWSECSVEGLQVRICENKGTCPDHFRAPETNKSCNYTPSCDDGVQNGDEEDVDCGGSCAECVECVDDSGCEENYKCVDNFCVVPEPIKEKPMLRPDVKEIEGFTLLSGVLIFILVIGLLFKSIKWSMTRYSMEEKVGKEEEKPKKIKGVKVPEYRKEFEPKETKSKKETKEKTEESKKEKKEETKREEKPKRVPTIPSPPTKKEEKPKTSHTAEKEETSKPAAKEKDKKQEVIGGLKEVYSNRGDIYVKAFREKQKEKPSKEAEEIKPIKIKANEKEVLKQLKDAYKLDSLGLNSRIKMEPKQSLRDTTQEKVDEDKLKNKEVCK